MCAPPKAPKVEKVPVRAQSALPNNGDPSIRQAERAKRRTGFSTDMIAKAAVLGTPVTSNPLGQTGNG